MWRLWCLVKRCRSDGAAKSMFRQNAGSGPNFSVLDSILLKLHMVVTGPALNIWHAFCKGAWLNGLATPSKQQPPRPISPTCTKFGTHMYHTQMHKKVSWTHRLNPTGSQPFWISWSFLVFSRHRIWTNSSYSNDLIDFKTGVYHLDKCLIKSYQKNLNPLNPVAVAWRQILMSRHDTHFAIPSAYMLRSASNFIWLIIVPLWTHLNEHIQWVS